MPLLSFRAAPRADRPARQGRPAGARAGLSAVRARLSGPVRPARRQVPEAVAGERGRHRLGRAVARASRPARRSRARRARRPARCRGRGPAGRPPQDDDVAPVALVEAVDDPYLDVGAVGHGVADGLLLTVVVGRGVLGGRAAAAAAAQQDGGGSGSGRHRDMFLPPAHNSAGGPARPARRRRQRRRQPPGRLVARPGGAAARLVDALVALPVSELAPGPDVVVVLEGAARAGVAEGARAASRCSTRRAAATTCWPGCATRASCSSPPTASWPTGARARRRGRRAARGCGRSCGARLTPVSRSRAPVPSTSMPRSDTSTSSSAAADDAAVGDVEARPDLEVDEVHDRAPGDAGRAQQPVHEVAGGPAEQQAERDRPARRPEPAGGAHDDDHHHDERPR